VQDGVMMMLPKLHHLDDAVMAQPRCVMSSGGGVKTAPPCSATALGKPAHMPVVDDSTLAQLAPVLTKRGCGAGTGASLDGCGGSAGTTNSHQDEDSPAALLHAAFLDDDHHHSLLDCGL
jgi:hypothetical protein